MWVRAGHNGIDSGGVKKRVGGYVLERERLVGIKAPSLTHTPISPVYFLGGESVCLCVCFKDKECVLVPLQYRGLITAQDASAASGDLSAGGTLLSWECGFFSL